jgi:hypothetical protein
VGASVGTACFANAADAVADFCRSITGPAGPGLLSCGGRNVFNGTATQKPTASVMLKMDIFSEQWGWYSDVEPKTLTVSNCDYKAGLDYWQAPLAAFFLALVLLVCARMIYRTFSRETA